jgi:hypothetical protein
MSEFDPLWLEKGHHWDLHCERRPAPDNAGSFTGGGWKLVWHITVSRWEAVDQMADVVLEKRAEPHFVIGGRRGVVHPVVIQLLPLNVAGRSLVHSQSPQTNRANAIQVEICAEPNLASAISNNSPRADIVSNWGDSRYAALANLAVLVSHRVDIPMTVPRSFKNARRFGASAFVDVAGHTGHMHAPLANEHSDPTTAFRGDKLLKFMKQAPNQL